MSKPILSRLIPALTMTFVAIFTLFRCGADRSATPDRRSDAVTITEDPAAVARCANLREINLSGPGDGSNRNAERDADLEAIAAHSGGNVILILERSPEFVRGQV